MKKMSVVGKYRRLQVLSTMAGRI